MNMPFAKFPEATNRIVYIREVAVADLPEELQAQVQDRSVVFALHDADGERLALAADRTLAFALARHHDATPVNVH
jgi:hypothetical protein